MSLRLGAGDPETSVLSAQPFGVALYLLDHREYRESYGMYACNGILFNHESHAAVRPSLRKITRGLARIDACLDNCLFMGNLDSLRDWGHAVTVDTVMLQQEGLPGISYSPVVKNRYDGSLNTLSS